MKNKVALITGGNRGIGKSICERLAKENINIIINYYHHEDEAYNLVDELIKKYNIKAIAIKCDVSKEEDVEDMKNKILDEFSGIDYLINNAGVARDSSIFSKSIKEFKRVLDVNLIGTYLCTKTFGAIMKEKGYGKIINISSSNAIDSYYPESCDYDASKAGIISLTHNFALSLAPNVYVNTICPGWVNTNMNDGLTIEQIEKEKKHILLNRFANPKEIANVVLFLLSDEASYINDSIIKVDGGRSNE